MDKYLEEVFNLHPLPIFSPQEHICQEALGTLGIRLKETGFTTEEILRSFMVNICLNVVLAWESNHLSEQAFNQIVKEVKEILNGK